MEGRRSSGTDSSTKGSQSSASDRQEQPVTAKPEGSPTLCSLLLSSPEDINPPDESFVPSEALATPERACVSIPAEPPESVSPPGSSYNTPAATPVPLPEETNITSTETEAPQLDKDSTTDTFLVRRKATLVSNRLSTSVSKVAEPVIVQNESSNSEHVEPRPQTPPPAAIAEPVSPPSRTGSPGAPPLPRRAAARRPVPPLPPAGPRAPNTPRPTEATKQPNGHHVEETEVLAEPDSKADIPNPDVIAPESAPPPPPSSEEPSEPPKEKKEEEEGGQADVLPAAERTESPVQEQETPGAEAEIVDVAGEAAEPNGDQSDEQQAQPQSESQPEPSLPADGSTPHGDGDGDAAAVENYAEVAGTTATPNDPDAEPEPERPNGEEKAMVMSATVAEEEEQAATPATDKARQPPLPPPHHPRPPVRSTERRVLSDVTGNSSKAVDKSDTGKSAAITAEPEYAPDGMPYVGDATWEERTWKELTRLREDMFWARLGSTQ
jgi:Rab guanine nucleotide exchange factor SEC2